MDNSKQKPFSFFLKKNSLSLSFSFSFFSFSLSLGHFIIIMSPPQWLHLVGMVTTIIMTLLICDVSANHVAHPIQITSHRPYHHMTTFKRVGDDDSNNNYEGATDGQDELTLHNKRSGISGSGGIALGDCGIIGFSIPLTIGTGGSAQTFQVILDTGSGVTGVVSSSCNVNTCLHASPTYTNASTATSLGGSITMTYGSGSWSGKAYTDTQSIGSNLVSGVLLGAITSQSNFLPNTDCQLDTISATPVQGIVGMAYGDVEGYDSYATLLNRAFALQLCESGGQMWIGTANSSYYSSGPNYISIAGGGTPWYNIVVTQLFLGGVTMSTSLGTSILDSGTTLMYMPSSAYMLFTSMLSSNSLFMATFPDMLSDSDGSLYTTANGYTTAMLNSLLPSMSWLINGVNYTLTPVDSYLNQFNISGAVYYGLGIASSGSGGNPGTILGWTFMNQFITFFDQPNNRVGLAPSTSCQNVWVATAWSACNVSCGAGFETRSLTCVDYLGETLLPGACHNSPPASTQSCTNGPCTQVTAATTTTTAAAASSSHTASSSSSSSSLPSSTSAVTHSTTAALSATVTATHTPTVGSHGSSSSAPTAAAIPHALLILAVGCFWYFVLL